MTTPFLGQIQPFAFGLIPKGWAVCNGQMLSVSQNQPLFALIGTTFGGNGQTTFALPDLQGRLAIGTGSDGVGPSFSLGSRAGTESYALAANEMPAHRHSLMGSTATATATSPTGNALAAAQTSTATALDMYGTGAATGNMGPATIGNAGTGQGHENRMPYLVVNICIALQGIFPSRS